MEHRLPGCQRGINNVTLGKSPSAYPVTLSHRTQLNTPAIHPFTLLQLIHPTTSKMSSSITNALPSLGKARLLINSPDDVVVVSAVRTPFTKVS